MPFPAQGGLEKIDGEKKPKYKSYGETTATYPGEYPKKEREKNIDSSCYLYVRDWERATGGRLKFWKVTDANHFQET